MRTTSALYSGATERRRSSPLKGKEPKQDAIVCPAPQGAEQLARENRSLAERIRQWIRKWVRSLKAAMEDLTADRPESRTMMQYAQELQEI